jgi:ribosomal 30S subunit maturation factor RimM
MYIVIYAKSTHSFGVAGSLDIYSDTEAPVLFTADGTLQYFKKLSYGVSVIPNPNINITILN